MQSYAQMKNSGVAWLGDIPAEWQQKHTKYLFQQVRESVGSDPSQYELLSLTLRGIIPRSQVEGGKNPENYDAYQVVHSNDLIMCLFDYDVTPRTVGRATSTGMVTGAYTVLKPADDVGTRFYNYFFLALDESKELLHLCTGLRNGLSKPTFFGLNLPVPSYETQEKIADFLDTETAKIDDLIAKQEKLLELLEEKSRATIATAVRPTMNTTEERFRDICTLNPATQSSFKDDDVVSFYPMESIGDDGTIDHSQTRPYTDVKTGYTVFKNNDVVVAKVTPCFENYKGAHMTNIASGVGFGTTELFVLRANKKVTPEYLYWLTQAQDFNNYLTGGMRGTGGLKRVVPEELKNYKVNIPVPETQKQIVANLLEDLKKFEALKQKVAKQIDLLKERRTSLISHAVTGKVKI